MLTRRERLMATLRGDPVDRPAVNFYEIGGFEINPDDLDPFNIYNDPSWRPLLQLAEDHTDLIRLRPPVAKDASGGMRDEFVTAEQTIEDGALFTRTRIEINGRTLTSTIRRDPDVGAAWHIERLLKDVDDLKAYLQIPDEVFARAYDTSSLVSEEQELGERGIIMVDTEDPLCVASELFAMSDYLIVAMTEKELFHALLEKMARPLHAMAEQVAREYPGHLWRLFGPEYASEPYLPPNLFEEYVVKYTGPMVDMIQQNGGFARIHCHGRLRNILPHIAAMGAAALEPIEPPPQGDVELSFVRKEYGADMVLMGNLEASDIENLEPLDFEKVVKKSLADGTEGEGRGFVLMPSACPYGRKVSDRALANYETIVRLATGFAS